MRRVAVCLIVWFYMSGVTPSRGQTNPQASAPPAAPPAARQPAAGAPQTPSQPGPSPLPGDWAPDLLYGIWNSSNSQAAQSLYFAAFAAGPDLIPDLEPALKDDRTAEFAAQSLAFIGGNHAMEILARLTSDPRDLGLKRFFYGALAEMDTPQATQILLDAIAHSDSEPDRTITEAAILALTVRTDATLVPKLEALKAKAHDPVVRDDLDNACDVIEARAKYLATPSGQNPDYSIERAVRTYFIPALEGPGADAPAKLHPAARGATSRARGTKPSEPLVSVKIDHLVFSPDKTRALARVLFVVPSALAHYDMVLVKEEGNWRLASVWLGSEEEISSSH